MFFKGIRLWYCKYQNTAEAWHWRQKYLKRIVLSIENFSNSLVEPIKTLLFLSPAPQVRRLLIRLRERKRNSSEETRSNVDPCRRFNVVDSGTVGGVAWERVKCGTIGVKRNSCAEMLKKTDRSFELRSLAMMRSEILAEEMASVLFLALACSRFWLSDSRVGPSVWDTELVFSRDLFFLPRK